MTTRAQRERGQPTGRHAAFPGRARGAAPRRRSVSGLKPPSPSWMHRVGAALEGTERPRQQPHREQQDVHDTVEALHAVDLPREPEAHRRHADREQPQHATARRKLPTVSAGTPRAARGQQHIAPCRSASSSAAEHLAGMTIAQRGPGHDEHRLQEALLPVEDRRDRREDPGEDDREPEHAGEEVAQEVAVARVSRQPWNERPMPAPKITQNRIGVMNADITRLRWRRNAVISRLHQREDDASRGGVVDHVPFAGLCATQACIAHGVSSSPASNAVPRLGQEHVLERWTRDRHAVARARSKPSCTRLREREGLIASRRGSNRAGPWLRPPAPRKGRARGREDPPHSIVSTSP
jgi:hypothetical protein